MSKKSVVGYSEHRRTDLHIDEAGDKFTINTVQDAEPIVEANKRRYNDYGDKLSVGKRGEWHHAASIPFNIWEQWMKDTNGAIEKDSKLLARYLNDPDNKYFKVAPEVHISLPRKKIKCANAQ